MKSTDLLHWVVMSALVPVECELNRDIITYSGVALADADREVRGIRATGCTNPAIETDVARDVILAHIRGVRPRK